MHLGLYLSGEQHEFTTNRIRSLYFLCDCDSVCQLDIILDAEAVFKLIHLRRFHEFMIGRGVFLSALTLHFHGILCLTGNLFMLQICNEIVPSPAVQMSLTGKNTQKQSIDLSQQVGKCYVGFESKSTVMSNSSACCSGG